MQEQSSLRNLGKIIWNFFAVIGVILSVLASVLGLYIYFSGQQNLQETLLALGFHGPRMYNQNANPNGIIWDVALYNNQELLMPIVYNGQIQGLINGLRFDWGLNSPEYRVSDDYFSATFRTEQNFVAGTYCFNLEVDDGARVLLDGETIINAWWGYTPQSVYRARETLSEGSHQIEIHYFDEFDLSNLVFSWHSPAGPECVSINDPSQQ